MLVKMDSVSRCVPQVLASHRGLQNQPLTWTHHRRESIAASLSSTSTVLSRPDTPSIAVSRTMLYTVGSSLGPLPILGNVCWPEKWYLVDRVGSLVMCSGSNVYMFDACQKCLEIALCAAPLDPLWSQEPISSWTHHGWTPPFYPARKYTIDCSCRPRAHCCQESCCLHFTKGCLLPQTWC